MAPVGMERKRVGGTKGYQEEILDHVDSYRVIHEASCMPAIMKR